VKTTTLPAEDISRLLDRQRKLTTASDQIQVHELFEEILRIANQFVPSESGSVLIDDPHLKVRNQWRPENNELVFVACFGEKAEQLIGARMRAGDGIAGKVYLTGRPILSAEARRHASFYAEFDRQTSYQTRSLVCVPIRLGVSTCGVLELINRQHRDSYDERELELLQIFAGYISTSLQNVLDANRYRELAKRDDLTGLFNDRYFNQRLSDEVERAERTGGDLSLVFLDLDHFKNINDRHGHLVGSQTLREVALVLGRTGSEGGAIVSRYGGDEFVIIIPGVDLEGGLAVAERVRNAVASAEFRIEIGPGRQVRLESGTVTASLGVASYRTMHFPSAVELHDRKNEFIRAADQAMYQAKARGKDRVFFGSVVPRPAPTG
jgi:diguanylate cyclase (GGDEF)-like protein